MTAPAYDKTTDPHRVHEPTVRYFVAQHLSSHPDFDLVHQGDFTEGGDGRYASVQCVLRRPDHDCPWPHRPYSLSEVVLLADAKGVSGVSIIRSTYDLTEREAVELL